MRRSSPTCLFSLLIFHSIKPHTSLYHSLLIQPSLYLSPPLPSLSLSRRIYTHTYISISQSFYQSISLSFSILILMDGHGRGGCGSETQSEEEMDLRRGPWTMEEDLILVNYIANHGEGRWNSLARCAGMARNQNPCHIPVPYTKSTSTTKFLLVDFVCSIGMVSKRSVKKNRTA